MSTILHKELKDSDYTQVRKNLLRTKGGSLQRDFLEAVRNNQTFIDYIRSKISTEGSYELPLSPDPMTEDEFKAPPEDTEIKLYESWSELTPRMACRSTFWANFTCRHIEDQKVNAVYLAANGGNLPGGAERIDRALIETGNEQPKMIDRAVRTVLRRLGGLPEVRGNRSVYVDCPFARAWWREHLVGQIAQGDTSIAAQVRKVIRIHQTYWEKLVDRIVSRNSTFGSLKVRNAFFHTLARFIKANPESALRETKALERACRRITVHQGIRELSILDDAELEVILDSSARGRAVCDPQIAFQNNLVPLDIMHDDEGGESVNEDSADEPGKIWNWCDHTSQESNLATRRLEIAVRGLREQLLLKRELQYCALPAETDPTVAIDIFIETNKSSLTIKRFDIVVALAQESHEEDLRRRISDFHNESTETTHHFSRNEEKAISEIGEWLLKVACLKANLPPKERHYEKALDKLFENEEQSGKERLNELQKNLDATLAIVAKNGGATEDTLPALPPVYVIAALQDDLRAIKKAARKGTANKLITTYLWRAFLTDRYEAQANDRLFEDFKGLQRCLEQIKDKGNYADPPVIFNDTEHSLPTAEELTKPLQWIRRKRLGRAVAAIGMRRMPRDWVTGDTLDANTIRTLEDTSNLDRHHVFPREFLKAHCTTEEINHGLNGVLLTKGSNRALSKKDPARYLQWILKETKDLSVTELRGRVESHLVPYDALKSAGTTKSRYKNFLKKRAQLVAAEIATVGG